MDRMDGVPNPEREFDQAAAARGEADHVAAVRLGQPPRPRRKAQPAVIDGKNHGLEKADADDPVDPGKPGTGQVDRARHDPAIAQPAKSQAVDPVERNRDGGAARGIARSGLADLTQTERPGQRRGHPQIARGSGIDGEAIRAAAVDHGLDRRHASDEPHGDVGALAGDLRRRPGLSADEARPPWRGGRLLRLDGGCRQHRGDQSK